MSKKYLDGQADIHAGDEDLIFPHHENETARSEVASGKEFAGYWVHNTFLNIDSQKISKSLGNFSIIREISEKYNLQMLRFFMLSAHYKNPLSFSVEPVESSKSGLERILAVVEKLRDLEAKAVDGGTAEAENGNVAEAEVLVEKYGTAMDDDFNTVDAIVTVFELVKLSNFTADAESTKAYISYVKGIIEKLRDVLGIIIKKKEEVLNSEMEALIEARQQARKGKNPTLADEIRGKLLDMGIVLEDTREGVKWKRAQKTA